MENIELQNKGEKLKQYLIDKEQREKLLLLAFQDCSQQLRDLYRCGEISYEDYKKCEARYHLDVRESEDAYKQFLIDLKSK